MSIFNSLLHEDTWHKDEPHNTWDDSQEQDDNSGFGDTASDIKHKQNSFADESADVFEESTEDSGFDGFGVDKLGRPAKYGLDAGIAAADQFADASDGKDTDVDLSFHDSFHEDFSGFEKDASLVNESEEVPVDPNTIPQFNNEDDNFEASFDDGSYADGASPAELAEDDSIDESTTGWDDLY